MNKGYSILYEDNDIIICHKRAGIPVQSKDVFTTDIESMLKNYLAQTTGNRDPYLAVVHRLDQPVEGVMVFAKKKAAAASLSGQITEHKVDKYYFAVVEGIFSNSKGTLSDYLLKDGKTNTSRVVNAAEPGGKEAVLEYEVLETRKDKQLLKIHLLTGRHHQIRVQLSHAGHPIVEDTKYNPLYQNKKGKFQTALCSYCIGFLHPGTKKYVTYQIQPSGKIFHEFTYCNSK